MFESLIQLDRSLFQLINQDLTNGFLDTVIPVIRNKSTWFAFYVGGVLILYFKFRMRGLLVSLLAIGTVAITDQVSATFIKQAVERLRPCNAPGIMEQARVLITCGSGFSFVSSHAANHFGLALLFGSLFARHLRWLPWVLLVWAGAISYGQVYVGVHYPSDVLVGGLIGALVGLGTAWIGKRYLIKKEK